MRRKRKGFIPVRGSSSVGTGTSSSGVISGTTSSGTTSVHVFEMTADGFAGAFKTTVAFLSGLGVTNSLRAPAPSIIVDHDVPIAACTVRVYELHSSRSSERMRSTDSGISFTAFISPILTLLLSDCLDILSTILVISIPSEKVIRSFLLSNTLTDFKFSSVVVSFWAA